jgi:hypothetical protein
MKCVMIIDENLSVGLIANTAAVLALSIGDRVKGIIGEDVRDQDGQIHRGITQVPIPLLKGDNDLIHSIRDQLLSIGSDDIFFVDFCDVAQKSKAYPQYKAKLESTPTDQLVYLGIAIYGPKKQVDRLSGNIGLLR